VSSKLDKKPKSHRVTELVRKAEDGPGLSSAGGLEVGPFFPCVPFGSLPHGTPRGSLETIHLLPSAGM
jgi:hypothetical protein